MTSSIYRVLTPAGAFDAIFGEEEAPIEYSGDDVAIGFFKDWLSVNQISGENGFLLDADTLQPNDLYGFCQPTSSGITVIPPFDDLTSFAAEDIFDQPESDAMQIAKDDEKQEENTMQNILTESTMSGNVTLDGISGKEKLKLVKEAASIRANLQSIQSGIEKLKMVKRIMEIRAELGVGSGMTETNAEPQQATVDDVNEVMPLLKQFIWQAQLSVIMAGIKGEEGQFFIDKLMGIANTIKSMSKTYETDGQGDNAVAWLHYFKGSGDWYITEKDMEHEQIQAFGLADLGYGGELGYINIQELINSGVELDLYWEQKTVGAINSGSDEAKQKVDPRINTYNPEEILDALVENYGWTEKNFQIKEDDGSIIVATVKKDVGGGITTGMVNREGYRNVYAKLDNSMHLTLMRGDSSEFSVDCNEKDPKEAAKEFDDLTTDWAVRTAHDKKSLKVGAAPNDDNEQQVPKLADPIKDAFIAELNTLKTETDINRFNERLDEIAARIEQAGMLEALDIELNQTADVLTQLLSKAENGNN